MIEYTDEAMENWCNEAKTKITNQMMDLLEEAKSTEDPHNIAMVCSACTAALLKSLAHIMAATMPVDALGIAAVGIGGEFLKIITMLQAYLREKQGEE